MTPFLLIGAVALVSAYLARRIASARGRHPNGWTWAGALFGPLAVAAVALLPSRRPG